jgi:hypothetical protein
MASGTGLRGILYFIACWNIHNGISLYYRKHTMLAKRRDWHGVWKGLGEGGLGLGSPFGVT